MGIMALKKAALHDISGLIRQRRRELGLTQKQLGDKLGIDQRTVSSLEKRPGSISVKRLFAVLSALHLEVYLSNDSRDDFAVNRMNVDHLIRHSRI